MRSSALMASGYRAATRCCWGYAGDSTIVNESCDLWFRALLSSVDLLLLSNTLDSLYPRQRERVIHVFRNLVKNKGLPHDPKLHRVPFSNRKRKTVLFITSNHDLEKMADGCIHFDIDEEELPEMQTLDLDDDGVVSQEEFLAAAGNIDEKEARRMQKVFNEADLDGDGIVDTDEVS